MTAGGGDPVLSAIVIARDEAHCIEACLRSLAGLADEVVVLDSGSRDDTAAIARRLGAQVEVTDWPGFGPQKNRALALARGDWVLSIDADEWVTPELAKEMREVVRAPGNAMNGYLIPFVATWCGRPVRFGDWAGKRHLRLFRRARARFSDDQIHEKVLCEPPHGVLRGAMMHDTVTNEAQAGEKARHYAALSAQRLSEQGRGGLLPAAVHAGWNLFRSLIIKGGVLDGRVGLKVARATAYGTWLRYRIAGRLRRGLPESGSRPQG